MDFPDAIPLSFQFAADRREQIIIFHFDDGIGGKQHFKLSGYARNRPVCAVQRPDEFLNIYATGNHLPIAKTVSEPLCYDDHL